MAKQVLEVPYLLIGTVDQICEDVLARREQYGISYITVYEKNMEALAPGERAVFFVDETRPGTHVPHHRGNGIVKLDNAGNVRGTTVTLDDVKRQVKQGVQ